MLIIKPWLVSIAKHSIAFDGAQSYCAEYRLWRDISCLKTLVIFFSKLVFGFVLLDQNSGLYIIACVTLFSLSAVFLVGQLLVCFSTNDKLAPACNVYSSKIHRLFVCLSTTGKKPFGFKQNNIELFKFVSYTLDILANSWQIWGMLTKYLNVLR